MYHYFQSTYFHKNIYQIFCWEGNFTHRYNFKIKRYECNFEKIKIVPEVQNPKTIPEKENLAQTNVEVNEEKNLER